MLCVSAATGTSGSKRIDGETKPRGTKAPTQCDETEMPEEGGDLHRSEVKDERDERTMAFTWEMIDAMECIRETTACQTLMQAEVFSCYQFVILK